MYLQFQLMGARLCGGCRHQSHVEAWAKKEETWWGGVIRLPGGRPSLPPEADTSNSNGVKGDANHPKGLGHRSSP